LLDEIEMRSINLRLQPKIWLEDIQWQNLPTLRSLNERSMISQPEISL
jgi:hypothetical protein